MVVMTSSAPPVGGYTPRMADVSSRDIAEPPSTAVDLGPNIRARRKEHGLSLRELARRVGVSASALSQIENGHSRPTVNTLYELARQLGVTPDEIFFGPSGDGAGDVDRGADRHADGDVDAANGRSDSVSVQHGGLDAHLSEVLELVPRRAQQVVTVKGGEICRQVGGHSLPGVDVLVITYEAGAASPGPEDFVRHSGHEFNYVISGVIEVHVRDKRYRLEPGDSLTFPSDWPHRVTNPTAVDAEVMCLFVRGR